MEPSGETASLHGRIAVGILIVQDLAAVAFLALAAGERPDVRALLLLILIPLRPLLGLVLQRVGHGELLVLYGFLLALGGAEAFELAGLKGDLGALVLGVLFAGHDKADELAKTMLGFKDLFLVGFFLSIGVSGPLTTEVVVVGAAITPFVFFKSALFLGLLAGFRLRARTSLLASSSLTSFSEFGLIVAAVGVANGWIDSVWLSVIAVALSLSCVIAAGVDSVADRIYARYRTAWHRLQRRERLADDRMLDTGGATILILGMGRIGAGAYEAMHQRHGETVVGVDIDPRTVREHRSAGSNVLLGDPSDADFWDRIQDTHTVELVMLALPNLTANLAVLDRLRVPRPGRTRTAPARPGLPPRPRRIASSSRCAARAARSTSVAASGVSSGRGVASSFAVASVRPAASRCSSAAVQWSAGSGAPPSNSAGTPTPNPAAIAVRVRVLVGSPRRTAPTAFGFNDDRDANSPRVQPRRSRCARIPAAHGSSFAASSGTPASLSAVEASAPPVEAFSTGSSRTFVAWSPRSVVMTSPISTARPSSADHSPRVAGPPCSSVTSEPRTKTSARAPRRSAIERPADRGRGTGAAASGGAGNTADDRRFRTRRGCGFQDEKMSSRRSSRPTSSGERSVSSRPKVRGRNLDFALQAMDLDGLGDWVDQPVLGHAIPAVERQLRSAVPLGGRWRQDLDHEVGGALHFLAIAQELFPLPGDEQDVRLHDIVGRQQYVAGRVQQRAQRPSLDELPQLRVDLRADRLVLEIRSRDHDQFAVQQLVAAVRRRGAVVLVCELDGGLRSGHVGALFPCPDARGNHDSASRRSLVVRQGRWWVTTGAVRSTCHRSRRRGPRSG